MVTEAVRKRIVRDYTSVWEINGEERFLPVAEVAAMHGVTDGAAKDVLRSAGVLRGRGRPPKHESRNGRIAGRSERRNATLEKLILRRGKLNVNQAQLARLSRVPNFQRGLVSQLETGRANVHERHLQIYSFTLDLVDPSKSQDQKRAARNELRRLAKTTTRGHKLPPVRARKKSATEALQDVVTASTAAEVTIKVNTLVALLNKIA